MKTKKKTIYRNQFLADGPIHGTVKGTKKGKKGYSRKNKDWKKDQ